ncbi:hypothetical protein BMS3Abin10_01798 [bacterium BMS3Abin10]|nr:hypothetical protein BMS3Abin10_01798 [bacterium BMS3Abin10]GBE39057.1 hypothetical protein BMS3Bbin08_01675 [bacterium BMS3Bbin08]
MSIKSNKQTNENKLNLSKKEKKLLSRLEKDCENISARYLVAALFLCVALGGLIYFIKDKNQTGFFIAVIFGGFGCANFFVSRVYKQLYGVIAKMQQHIKELENSEK